jgi:sec-independent protein translocase protein TatA
MGFLQLLVIMFIILLLFGAGKLPKVMSELGRGMRQFRRSLADESEGAAVSLEPSLKTVPLSTVTIKKEERSDDAL